MLWKTLIILLTNGFVNSQHFNPTAPAPEDFDINTDQAIIFSFEYTAKVIYKYLSVDASNTPVSIFAAFYFEAALFDSLAPYYPMV